MTACQIGSTIQQGRHRTGSLHRMPLRRWLDVYLLVYVSSLPQDLLSKYNLLLIDATSFLISKFCPSSSQMADPLTIIGCVGGLCNVIDCATKAISALNRLRTRWATADLAILTLASQLMALRAALAKLQTWSEHNHPESLHYQLVMDLDGSVEACQLLVSKLEAFVSSLETSTRPLDFSSRLKVAFGHGRADHIEKLLQQQTSALTLLLTALNRSVKMLNTVKRY